MRGIANAGPRCIHSLWQLSLGDDLRFDSDLAKNMPALGVDAFGIDGRPMIGRPRY
jgi:hypothetical protein